MQERADSERMLEPSGRTRLEIDLDKVRRNYQKICDQVAPAAVMAVLKDNAYGHGLVRYARHLLSCGCTLFGVATLHEALLLKNNALSDCTILILRALTEREIPTAVSAGFDVVVADSQALATTERVSASLGLAARVHVKVDTGLGRLGFLPCDVPSLVDLLRDTRAVRVVGIASHFAVSAPHHDFHYIQLERFNTAVEQIREVVPGIKRHIAASAASVGLPESRLDMVRVSNLLYGLSYTDEVPWGLELTLTWKAPLIQVKSVPPGWNVGYGLKYQAATWLRLGVIAVGAGDGLPYSLTGVGSVLVRGRRCRIIGMSLDQSMVDLTDVQDACVGDDAVVVGSSGECMIRPEQIARLAGTSSGAILSTLSSRLPRFYFEGGCLRSADTMEHYVLA